MTNTLLISEKYVKTQSNIQDNVWGDFLTPAIREAQDIELQPIIGRPLYKKILKEVEEKDVEERFKTLIEDWIQPYLLYQTIVSLIPIIGTKLGNIGTVISNDEHVQNISSSERENLEYRYRYLADHYKSELQKYLLANKDLYPELTSTCLKNLNLKSSNSLPLWTGGLRHGQRETTDCPDKADYADPDGRKAGYIEGGKTVSVTKNNATTTILPSEGYDGFSSVEVEVNVPIEESKTVKITENNSTTTISASEGYDGIKDVNVEVNVPIQDKKTVSVTKNNSTTTIVPDEGYDGISIVDVEVNVPIQDKKTVEVISTTGTTTITPDEGYDGIKNVELNINAQYPQILFKGQTLRNHINLNIKENKGLIDIFDYFDFRNITSYEKMFSGFELTDNFNNTTNGDFSKIGTIDCTIGNTNKIIDDMFWDCFTKIYKTKVIGNYIAVYDIKIPTIILASTEMYGLNLISYGTDYRYFHLNKNLLNNIKNLDKVRLTDYFFHEAYIDDPEVFSDCKLNETTEKFIYSIFFDSDDENQYLNMNYLKNNNYTVFYLGRFSYGNFDVSDIEFKQTTIITQYSWVNYFGVKKLKLSKKCFSSTSINTYEMTSPLWTDQQNLQEFIDALPQNTTSRTIKLSSNTMNALTDEMKATAANKNWTLTT